MTFLGGTEHFSGKIGALRWSILVGKQKHNIQKPNPWICFPLVAHFSLLLGVENNVCTSRTNTASQIVLLSFCSPLFYVNCVFYTK